jgi:hypothetical protein
VPRVLIEIRRAIPAEEESRLMEAVHSALREAFRILPGDRNVRLIAHEPHRFVCPPERTHPELYTHISIDAFAGRSLDAESPVPWHRKEVLSAVSRDTTSDQEANRLFGPRTWTPC